MTGVIRPGERLRAIFDDQEPVFFCEINDRCHRDAGTVEVRNHDRARFVGDGVFDCCEVRSQRGGGNIQRNWNKTVVPDDIGHLLDGVHRDHRHIVIIPRMLFLFREDFVFILPVDDRVAPGEYFAAFEHFRHAAPPGAYRHRSRMQDRRPPRSLTS